MRRYPRVTVTYECPYAELCAGYDRDVCPMADVVAEVPETILICPSDTYILDWEDGRAADGD